MFRRATVCSRMNRRHNSAIASRADAALDPPWRHLREFTSARIAIGRTGGSQPGAAVLDFRLSHARARDAVHAPFHPEEMAAAFKDFGREAILLHSQTRDRRQYLLRPDLGRRLHESSVECLREIAKNHGSRDLAVIVSDGLAARAAESHAMATALPLLDLLEAAGWTFFPVIVVPLARVKIQDEIGSLLGAKITLMLLGERPGLGAPDSLGAYFTYAPAPTKTDADRNCLSNIRPEGLPPAAAAKKLANLLLRSAQLQFSGVSLKDEEEMLPDATPPGHPRLSES